MWAGAEQGYVGSETRGVVEEPLQFLMKLDAKQALWPNGFFRVRAGDEVT
jgi:hypothetical protein